MVDWLKKEDEYWCNMAADSRLWSEKTSRTDGARKRHEKRRRLTHYSDHNKSDTQALTKDHGNDISDANQDDSCPESDSDNDDDDGIIDLVASTTPSNSDGKQHANGRKRPCPECHKLKIINKECSLKSCKKCCCKSPSHCTVTDHKQSKKVGAPRPYLETSLANAKPSIPNSASVAPFIPSIEEKIKSAKNEKRPVFISYLGGPPRKILPNELVIGREGGTKTKSFCYFQNKPRDFYLYKIHRIEDFDWTREEGIYMEGRHIMCMKYYSYTILGQGPKTSSSVLPASIEEYLKGLNLERYLDVFTQTGFDMVDTLRDLEEADLNNMRVPRGHQGKLLRRAKEIAALLK